jgi:glycerophosphoryl diester phosphodiesterase
VTMTREAEATVLAPHYRLLSKETVDAARAARLQVIPWTANDAAEWDRLIGFAVDAIITDDPAGLIAHLKKRGLR